MPELPDITIYVERIAAHLQGQELRAIDIYHPFLLRSVKPMPQDLVGRQLARITRLGKRIVLAFADDSHREIFACIHLMIAGRFTLATGAAKKTPSTLAMFRFERHALLLTEAGSKRRASLTMFASERELLATDRGGLDVLRATPATFAQALREKNHTIKRALTDPTIIDGVGNAYSDEILHRAGMSPYLQTKHMTDQQFAHLLSSACNVLREWIERLQSQAGEGFPAKVTAFHPEMAVHGKFGQPCPVCGTAVQRIRYAENEANYCPHCQTSDKLLADRGLSRLLKQDWPKTLTELEERKRSL